MTTITRVVRRETNALIKNRPIVIELHPWGVRMKEKGRRYSFDVTFRQVYELGAENAAAARRREKAELRKTKRMGSKL